MSGKNYDADAVAKIMEQMGGSVSRWEVQGPGGFTVKTNGTCEDNASGLEALRALLARTPSWPVSEQPKAPTNAPTLADAVKAYAEIEGPTLKPNTWEQRRRAFASFVDKIGGSVRVDEVTRPMASAWADGLQRSGLSKRYAANVVSHVAQLFEAQRRKGYAHHQPQGTTSGGTRFQAPVHARRGRGRDAATSCACV